MLQTQHSSFAARETHLDVVQLAKLRTHGILQLLRRLAQGLHLLADCCKLR